MTTTTNTKTISEMMPELQVLSDIKNIATISEYVANTIFETGGCCDIGVPLRFARLTQKLAIFSIGYKNSDMLLISGNSMSFKDMVSKKSYLTNEDVYHILKKDIAATDYEEDYKEGCLDILNSVYEEYAGA